MRKTPAIASLGARKREASSKLHQKYCQQQLKRREELRQRSTVTLHSATLSKAAERDKKHNAIAKRISNSKSIKLRKNPVTINLRQLSISSSEVH